MSAGGSRQRRESGQPQREAARRSAGNEVGRKRTVSRDSLAAVPVFMIR